MSNKLIRPAIPISLVLASVLFFCIYGFLNLCFAKKIPNLALRESQQLRAKAIFECEIITDPKQGPFNTSVQAKVKPKNQLVRLVGPIGTELGSYGSTIRVIGIFKPLKFSKYDKVAYLTGSVGEISVRSVQGARTTRSLTGLSSELREKISSYIDRVSGDHEGRALLKALLLGNRNESGEFEESFRRAGLSHLMSVSGAHLAIVCGCIIYLMSKARFSKLASVVCSVIVGVGFAFITGLSPSTLRALWMYALAGCVFMFGRRKDGLHIVGLTVCILLLSTPHLAASIGFQLSVSAVTGILLFSRLIELWVRRIFFFLPRFVHLALAVTFAAQGATLPIAVPVFESISIISPVANVLAGALTSLALSAGLAGSALVLIVEPLGLLVLKCSVAICASIVSVAARCGALSWSSIDIKDSGMPLAFALCLVSLLALLYFLWPIPKNQRSLLSPKVRLFFQVVLFILTIFFLIWALFPELPSVILPAQRSTQTAADGVYILDVGQGDAILVRSKGRTALIDAGPDSAVLKTELRKLRVTKIDTLIFTHTHQDHLGGARGLEKSFGIKEIIVADGAEYDKDIKVVSRNLSVEVRTILAGDLVEVGEFDLTCLSPKISVYDSDANESCLVLFVDDDEAPGADYENILITGDAEAITVMQAIRRTQEQVEVFKVGHHGAFRSLNENLLVIMQPEKAVISVGRDNSYGHPKPDVLQLLNRFGIPYLRTDLAGTIYIGAKAQ